jgi:hypothetical protein
LSRFNGICPTCGFSGGQHGGHCPNNGLPEAEWTIHEERVAARRAPHYASLLAEFRRISRDTNTSDPLLIRLVQAAVDRYVQ